LNLWWREEGFNPEMLPPRGRVALYTDATRFGYTYTGVSWVCSTITLKGYRLGEPRTPIWSITCRPNIDLAAPSFTVTGSLAWAKRRARQNFIRQRSALMLGVDFKPWHL